MKNFIVMSILMVAAYAPLFGQNFLDDFKTYSKKKDAYLTLANGKEYKGTIAKLSFKKGLIKELVININGKKKEFSPDDVKSIYVPALDLEKFGKAIEVSRDATKWDDDHSAHAEYIKEGYAFFESTEVIVKKKQQLLLLQLLNPGFANGIKVYSDPNTQESASMEVGGIKVAGGAKKSYYIKKGDAPAVKVTKGKFNDFEKTLFGDCSEIFEKFGQNLSWFDLERIVFHYSENCSK